MSSKQLGQGQSSAKHISAFKPIANSLDKAKALFSFTEKKFSNFLLVDSVVSIFSAYFVDEKVGSEDVLLSKLIETLNSYADVKAHMSVSNIWLEVRGKKTKIKLPAKISITRVSNILIKAATFVDQHAPEMFVRAKKQYAKHNGPVVHILNDILESIDPHSVVLSTELYRELIEGTEGSFGGLGIVVGIQDSVLTVIKTIGDSPASRAKIKRGDRVLAIDGFKTYGLKLDDLIQKMRGPPNSGVRLTVLGTKSQRPKSIDLKRKKIDVASTEMEIEKIADKQHIAKIHIEHFSNRTSEDVESNLDDAQRKLGDKLSGIVLDLRSNPGGLLDQAVLVADLFLGKGNIVLTKGRKEEEIEFASNYQRFKNLPIVVLINHESASASEILAGALQDHDRAVVIGQRSFGKGSVQTIFELPGSMAMKITIAKYFTPSKNQIQGQGIVPDVWTEFVYGEGKYTGLNAQRLKLGRNFLRSSPSTFPSYYRRSPTNDEDFEFAMATKLLGDYSVSAKTFSAKKFLAQTKSTRDKYLGHAMLKATGALKKNAKVTWSRQGVTNEGYRPLVKLGLPNIYSSPGQWVKIPYTVTNNGNAPGSRVSVYMFEKGKTYSTQEHLIGVHKPGQKVSGFFRLRVPGNYAQNQMNLKVGLSSDVDPITTSEKDVLVQVNQAQEPSVSYSYKMISENKNKDGALETGEHATLELEFRNSGKRPVENIHLGLTNLSGKQVVSAFRGKKRSIARLSAGKPQKMYIELDAGNSLQLNDLELGVKMDAGGLRQPKFKVLKVKTKLPASPRGSRIAH